MVFGAEAGGYGGELVSVAGVGGAADVDAAAQAVRIDARGDRAIEAYLLLAERVPWDEASRWLRLSLHHGEWTRALPTLLWAEPRAAR